MKYVFRTLWLIGYIPVFVIEMCVFVITLLTYPLVAAFYFIKCGNTEDIPYMPENPPVWIDNKYTSLLKFI